jgi:tRNA pseudouridine-54 N-methylase
MLGMAGVVFILLLLVIHLYLSFRTERDVCIDLLVVGTEYDVRELAVSLLNASANSLFVRFQALRV